MNPAVVTRVPSDLRPHPLNCQMPRWTSDSQEWLAFLEDVQANGIKTPIRITERNEVVDGETRRLAARALNLPEIPCVIVGADEVNETMLRELQFRRNLTKGQRAYLAYPLLEGAVQSIRTRQITNLISQGRPSVDSVDSRDLKVGDFARSLGFSRDLFFQAQRLRDAFAQHPDLQEQFEPRILSFEDPIGLGACLAGIAAVLEANEGDHGGGRPVDTRRQMELFVGTFTRDLRNRFAYWEKWDERTRVEVVRGIAPAIEIAPIDFLDQLESKIKAERRRRNKETQSDE